MLLLLKVNQKNAEGVVFLCLEFSIPLLLVELIFMYAGELAHDPDYDDVVGRFR